MIAADCLKWQVGLNNQLYVRMFVCVCVPACDCQQLNPSVYITIVGSSKKVSFFNLTEPTIGRKETIVRKQISGH
jgi:hypothetical protein